MRRLHRTTERGAFFALTTAAALLYLLYFLHLRADYPALLPAVDWARYTDEGWYGSAALHSMQGRPWFNAGGFNPAIALPVWPLLLRAWFALTGPGMVAARALTVLLFGATALLLFALLRPLTGRVLAVSAVLLMLSSPFSYGYDRMAILEPLVALLFLLALWIARPRIAQADNRSNPGAPQGTLSRAILTGLLLTAMVLTKTTAVLLAPAVLYLLWQSARTHRHDALDIRRTALATVLSRAAQDRAALGSVALASAVALATWLAYFLTLVRPHHLADYHHLFLVNAGKAHGRILLEVMARALGDGTWMGGLVYGLMLLLLAASLRYLRELWRIPLFGSAVLALVLPIGFIGWHTWFLPHYYLPSVAPMLIVVALGLHALSRRAHAIRTAPWRIAHLAANIVAEAAFALMLLGTLTTAFHPRYTYADAAANIAARIRSEPAHPPLLLASPGDDIALFTGVPAANPEWPIGGIRALLRAEQPGWFGGFLPLDAKAIAHMQGTLPLEEVARYQIQPDPDHQVFLLYRIRTTRNPTQ